MRSSFWLKSAAIGSLFLLPALAYAATAGFSSPSFSVKEGGTAAIKVKLNGARSEETTVRVLVYPGTAWRGSYAPSGVQKLSFPAGSTEQSFDIKTFKTGRAKHQTVGLRLISVSGAGNTVNRSANTSVLVIKKGDVATTTPPPGGNPPTGRPTCPANNRTINSFRGIGNPDLLRLHSGEIGVYQIPGAAEFGGLGNGVPLPAGSIVLSENTNSPTGNVVIEMAVSQCPGDMQQWTSQPRRLGGTTYYPCRALTSNPHYSNVSVSYTTSSSANHCYTPAAQGPWYVNVRYQYDTEACPLSGNWCGQRIQWNPDGGAPAPTLPPGTVEKTFREQFAHNYWMTIPGTPGPMIVAALPTGITKLTAQIVYAPSPRTNTPSSGYVEYSISKQPGVIGTNRTNRCNIREYVSYMSLSWVPRAFGAITDAASANANGYCWAPESEGPWYLNTRYFFPDGCPYGAGECGVLWQWN